MKNKIPPRPPKMITFKKVLVYLKNPSRKKRGITGISFLKKRMGIYKIFEDGKIIYVGSSNSDLYKTILRHFQEWNDKEQLQRISYKSKLKEHRYEVEATITNDLKYNLYIEHAIINELKPRDNKIGNYNLYRNKMKQSQLDSVKLCFDCYNKSIDKKSSVEDFEDLDYNESGELIDSDGNVIF